MGCTARVSPRLAVLLVACLLFFAGACPRGALATPRDAGPSIDANGPYDGAVGRPISFVATLTNPPPSSTVSWDFGDGSSATGQVVSHVYTVVGTYSVIVALYQAGTVLVRDGAVATVTARPTSIEAGGPYSGVVGQAIPFTATLTSPPARYTVQWTFGDGTSAQGLAVTHRYSAAGTYPLTVTVFAGAVSLAQDSSTVTVTTAVPALEAHGPYSGVVGVSISFSATVSNPPPGAVVLWAFGDGTTASGATVSHSYTAAGSYTAIATLYQAGVPIVSDSSTVTVVPQAPPSLPGGPIAIYPAGWNVVAGPAGTIFAQAAGPLYTRQAGDTGYQVLANTTPVVAGRGYWAYFSAPTVVSLGGAGTVVAAVAAPANQWVAVGNPSGTASVQVYGADLVVRYDPGAGRYVPAGRLQPGQGAWALSVQGGTITVAP